MCKDCHQCVEEIKLHLQWDEAVTKKLKEIGDKTNSLWKIKVMLQEWSATMEQTLQAPLPVKLASSLPSAAAAGAAVSSVALDGSPTTCSYAEQMKSILASIEKSGQENVKKAEEEITAITNDLIGIRDLCTVLLEKRGQSVSPPASLTADILPRASAAVTYEDLLIKNVKNSFFTLNKTYQKEFSDDDDDVYVPSDDDSNVYGSYKDVNDGDDDDDDDNEDDDDNDNNNNDENDKVFVPYNDDDDFYSIYDGETNYYHRSIRMKKSLRKKSNNRQ